MMDLIKGSYGRNDNYLNFMSQGEDEEYIEVG